MNRRQRRHCPHTHVRGIYGDEINAVGGYRLRCRDCGTLLDGPVAIAVEREAEAVYLAGEDDEPSLRRWQMWPWWHRIQGHDLRVASMILVPGFAYDCRTCHAAWTMSYL